MEIRGAPCAGMSDPSAANSGVKLHQASYSVWPLAGGLARLTRLSLFTARLVLRQVELARPFVPHRNRPTRPGYPSSQADREGRGPALALRETVVVEINR